MWNRVSALLCLAYFTQHGALQIQPFVAGVRIPGEMLFKKQDTLQFGHLWSGVKFLKIRRDGKWGSSYQEGSR